MWTLRVSHCKWRSERWLAETLEQVIRLIDSTGVMLTDSVYLTLYVRLTVALSTV